MSSARFWFSRVEFERACRYVAAEYGGGRWTYKNDAGKSERVEVSDYRAVFGIEWRDDYFSKLTQLSFTPARESAAPP